MQYDDELREKLAERDRQIRTLKDDLRQKEAIIEHVQTTAVQINHRLNRVRASWGWRMLGPLRATSALLARLRQKIAVDLVPHSQLEAEDAEGRSTGRDPQFLL